MHTTIPNALRGPALTSQRTTRRCDRWLHIHCSAVHRSQDQVGPAQTLVSNTSCHTARAHMGRRELLLAGAAAEVLALQVPQLAQPQPAAAAAITDAIYKVFPPPPQPVLFPRKALGQVFAVLLMRSSYDAVDTLDFIPMDSFQVKFWKRRQAEQEGYNIQYLPLRVRLGDLTDPLYFDFISFAQYAVVAQEMANGQQVFKEFCEECENQTQVVRRDPAFADNALLPGRFFDAVGDSIYAGLRDGFRGQTFGAPAAMPRGTPLPQVLTSVQSLLDIMVGQGYALKAAVTDVQLGSSPATGSFTLRVDGPANLWGLANLSFRRAAVVNAYDAMAVSAYLRASGLSDVSHTTSYTDTYVETRFLVA